MPEALCPFIGVEEDPETAVAFPSPRNLCHKHGKPQLVEVGHQGNYCMQAAYQTCPIYLQQSLKAAAAAPQAAPAKTPVKSDRSPSKSKDNRPVQRTPSSKPQSARDKPLPAQKKRRVRDMVVPVLALAGLLAIILSAVIILPASGGRFSLLPRSDTPAAGALPSSAQTEHVTPFLPVKNTTEIAEINPTATSTTQKTATYPVSTKTQAHTPSFTPAKLATTPANTPCGGPPYGWVRYVVRYGDTFSSISYAHGATVYQLWSANCMNASSQLIAGMTLYVPYVPPTQPYYPTAIYWTDTPVPTETFTQIPTVPTDTETVVPSDTVIPTEETVVVPTTTEPAPVNTDTPPNAGSTPVTDTITPEPVQETPVS